LEAFEKKDADDLSVRDGARRASAQRLALARSPGYFSPISNLISLIRYDILVRLFDAE